MSISRDDWPAGIVWRKSSLWSSAASASFQPAVENAQPAPGDPPAGVVSIPGGEFSMGAAESPDLNMVGTKAVTDSRPIHLVFVDGFWMEARLVP